MFYNGHFTIAGKKNDIPDDIEASGSMSHVPSQLGGIFKDDHTTHDAVFGKVTEDGPNYCSVSRPEGVTTMSNKRKIDGLDLRWRWEWTCCSWEAFVAKEGEGRMKMMIWIFCYNPYEFWCNPSLLNHLFQNIKITHSPQACSLTQRGLGFQLWTMAVFRINCFRQ